jgi:hypothetical protein
VIGIIRRDRGASALIYTTRSCGETRSLFFCQNRSEQNSLAVLGCAGMPATRRTRGTSAYLNNTRGVATTGKMCAADVAVGPERTPAAPPRERISADGDRAKAGDLVMFERFTPPDGGTEVENGSGTVLFDEDRSSMRGVWIETEPHRAVWPTHRAAGVAGLAAQTAAAAEISGIQGERLDVPLRHPCLGGR